MDFWKSTPKKSYPVIPGQEGFTAGVSAEISSWLATFGKGKVTKEFLDLIKAIGEAKSKNEEEQIIAQEIVKIRASLASPNSITSMRDILVRLMYCEMLGHSVPFGYIHAVNLTQESKLKEKKIGYLAATLFLHPEHELMVLLINSFKRDLASDNQTAICAALDAVAKLTNLETIPALDSQIVHLLSHPNPTVKKKAIMALHRLVTLEPEVANTQKDQLRRVLCDSEPSVMAASLNIFHDLCLRDPMPFKDLAPAFVSILKQAADFRFSADYIYHRVPAPWIQIKLLRILSCLGQNDQRTSEQMYEVVHDALRRADFPSPPAFAVLYECIRTAASIYPNTALLNTAAEKTCNLLTSDNHNLKYIAISSLALLIQVNPAYSANNELAVIQCLEDSDTTLKRKTLDLLCKMANQDNIEVIEEKLIEQLRNTSDVFERSDLLFRVTQLAERYAPSNEWFISTMNEVFLVGGSLVRPEIANTLINLIAEGTGEHEEAEMELRRYAVESYYQHLSAPVLPDILIQVIAWVLGEYGYLSEHQLEIIEGLCKLAERDFENPELRIWVATAIEKLVARGGRYPPPRCVFDFIEKYSYSSSSELQQRCYEFKQMAQIPHALPQIFPANSFTSQPQIDEQLSFLDDFVAYALKQGAKPYRPRSQVSQKSENTPSFKFTPYQLPAERPDAPPPPSVFSEEKPVEEEKPVFVDQGLNVSVPKLWTLDGYKNELPKSEPPPPPSTGPTATPVVVSPTAISSEPTAVPPTSAQLLDSGSGLDKTGPPKPTPVRQNPEDNKKLLEQQKLAASIFKGVPGAKSGTPKKGPSVASPKKPVSPTSPVSPNSAQPFHQPQSPFQQQPQQAPRPQQSFPQQQQGFGSQAPQGQRSGEPHPFTQQGRQQQFTQPQSPQPPIDLLLDLGLEPKATAQPTTGPGVMGSYTDLLTPVAATVLPIYHEGDPNKLSFPAKISSIVSGHARLFKTVQPVANDGLIALYFNKILKEDELIVMLYINNENTTTVTKITLNLNQTAKFELIPFASQLSGPLQLTLPTLSPRSTEIILIKVNEVNKDFTVPSIVGTLTYCTTTTNALSKLGLNIPLHISDFIRPVPEITTPLFAQHWPTHTAEVQTEIRRPDITTIQILQADFKNRLQLHPVAITGVAAIACGCILKDRSRLCLVHGELKAGGPVGAAKIRIRTSSRAFTDHFASQLASRIQLTSLP